MSGPTQGHGQPPAVVGLRAGLIFAPLVGAIVFMGTLDLAAAALATLAGGGVAGVFFAVAAARGRRATGRD